MTPRGLVATIVFLAAAMGTLAFPAAAYAQGAGDAAEAGDVDAVDAADRFADRAVDLLKTVGSRALIRWRRSVAIGPFVGAGPGVSFAGDTDFRLSFGLALFRFDIPVIPTAERIADILKRRARERFLAELRRLASGGRQPGEAELRALADQVWEDIKAEFLLEYQPHRFEKPSFVLLLEVDHLFVADAWELGLFAGLGVGPVNLSAGPVLHIDDGAALYTGVELALPMLISRGLRSPVVDFFLRADVATTGRAERADRLFVGARFALDII